MEAIITQPSDHAKLSTHRIVSPIRESVGIGPEDFLSYLHRRGITPCPELTSVVREERKRRERDQREKEKSRTSRSGRQSLYVNKKSNINRPAVTMPIVEESVAVKDGKALRVAVGAIAPTAILEHEIC